MALAASVVAAPDCVRCDPGATVSFSWTLANEGVEPWPAGCVLRPVDGSGSAGPVLVELPEVPAHGSVTCGFDMQAPEFPGTKLAQWIVLATSDGEVFGDTLEACVEVLAPAEPREVRPKMTLAVPRPSPKSRPHPHLGVYAGSFTRQHYLKYRPNKEPPQATWKSPTVLRQAPEELDGWHILDALETTPELVLAKFGSAEATKLRFTVNGELHTVRGGEYPISTSLAEYLRYQKALTGTKIGCGEGGCGACTVALRVFRNTEEGVLAAPEDKMIVNACLRPLHSVDNMEVTTIENLGTPAQPHAIQTAINKHHASQCGMCTPGFVMAIYGHLSRGGGTPEEAERCIQGNICRCTGYRPIYSAIRELNINCQEAANQSKCSRELAVIPSLVPRARAFAAVQGGQTWLNCFELADVFIGLRQYNSRPYRLVVGNTSMGVVKYYPPHPNDNPQVFINILHVQDLLAVQVEDNAVVVGAAVSLASLIDTLQYRTTAVPQFKPIIEHLKLVAHPQVRNVGSWAGNLMIAKTHKDFPSDVALLLTLLDASVRLVDALGNIQTLDVPSFLQSQEVPRVGADPQIIHSVSIPFPKKTCVIETFKVMRRKMNTHAELNAGFMFDFTDETNVLVASARIVLGNVALGPFLATETSDALKGHPLDASVIEGAKASIEHEVSTNIAEPSVPDPPFVVVDPTYRSKLAGNLLYKAALRARMARLGLEALAAEEQSAAEEFKRAPSRGTQNYKVDPSTGPIGESVPKYEGLAQACGTADYTADQAAGVAGLLFGVPVLADQLRTLMSIDASACLATVGVKQIISAQDVADIGASNDISGTKYKIFAEADQPINFVGQFVAVVVGDSPEAARNGAKAVKLEYKPEEKSASLEERRVEPPYDPIIIGKEPDHRERAGLRTVEGKLVSSGQRHFYMETQTTFAQPDGNGGLVVSLSTQVIDNAQKMVSETFKISTSKVKIQNMRVGGAYGGKAWIYVPVCAAAVASAVKMKAPVLIAMDRTGDFLSFGGRPPHEVGWTATFDSDGKITGVTQHADVQTGVDTASGFNDCTGLGCYEVADAKLQSVPVATSCGTKTIMRAPGNLESAFTMEAVIEQVARSAGVDHTVVQLANMHPSVKRAYGALKDQVDYDKTRQAVTEFNAANRYQKQGLYCMGAIYSFSPGSWAEKCLVTVHGGDGSVSISHSGIEVGQGMDTKAAQACVRAFRKVASDFSIDLIKIVEPKSSDFFSWAGLMPTWGSATSETVAYAVEDACKKIAEEMASHREDGRSWASTVASAASAGVKLTHHGDHLGGDSDYGVSCAGCAKVQVDVLTGETQVLSFDLVYDCGKSLNPGVDIGQLEGSIIQSLGYSLCEQEYKSKTDSRMVNCGTWDYKVPTGLDIPIDFNITLMDPLPDDTAGYLGSKASGEPAQLVGPAVFYAVKDAIYAARKDAGLPGDYIRLDPPASTERVLLACSS